MTTTPLRRVIPPLRRAALLPDQAGMTDGELLGTFIHHRDAAAFEVLVRRHGPMVLGVCRRILGNPHDADDAFQATFLVLVRKAEAIRSRELLASWLYGVAQNTARKLKAVNARRRVRERPVTAIPEPETSSPEPGDDLRPVLDREVAHLPVKYRAPLILCDLEGKTRKEAARELGWPEGTISGRLARARILLGKRLARHGLASSAGALALVLSARMASAGVPAPLLAATVEAAGLSATGQAATGIISTQVIALTEGVLQAMRWTKLKMAAVFLGISFLGFGTAGLVHRTQGADPTALSPETRSGTGESRPAQVGAAPVADIADEDTIVGSGKPATKEVKVADFTAVEVHAPVQLEITKGDTFRTSVTTDDNLLEHVKAVKEGSTLKISVDTGKQAWRGGPKSVLKVAITMPTLEGISLSAASRAKVKGFKSTKGFQAKVRGASSLEGEIQAGKVELSADGASRVKLQGSAGDVRLSGTGASNLMLADLAAARANVSLSGASKATVQVKEKLDYAVSGASRLEYRGDPTIGKKQSSGASSVSHK
jgi:RNA polymerase sigma-70 factor (ECF subfamily)